MKNINQYIDHTLLKPEATLAQIEELCREALKYSFASVCVNPCHVGFCADILKGSPVAVCTVIGFPLGANATQTKVQEAEAAILDGAAELDMVVNIGMVKSGDFDYVKRDVAALCDAARGRAALKVIFECCLLDDEEKIRLIEICKECRVDFIKTSTGFSKGGATVEDIRLFAAHRGGLKIKASGGIRSLETALLMIDAGADRIGCSAGVAIMIEAALST